MQIWHKNTVTLFKKKTFTHLCRDWLGFVFLLSVKQNVGNVTLAFQPYIGCYSCCFLKGFLRDLLTCSVPLHEFALVGRRILGICGTGSKPGSRFPLQRKRENHGALQLFRILRLQFFRKDGVPIIPTGLPKFRIFSASA